jgi:predicted lipoprotein with Yx(FWY)xxD motif
MKLLHSSLHLAAAFVMLASASCSDGTDPVVTPDPVFNITVKSTTKGNVLADSAGRSLYFFSRDLDGKSACTGGCLTNWPIYSKTKLNVDPSLTAADFALITGTDGKKQVTYKGWPLYYFKDDVAPVDVNGDNVGTVWFLAKTTYTAMIASGQLVGNDGKSYLGDYKEGTGATQFFVDDMGRTLYAFVNDKKNKNNFTNNDATHDASWPIFTAELKDLPTGVDKSLFATIDVFGKKQVTYKGWPLYYFGGDSQTRGLTKGVSVPRPGVWPIVNTVTTNAPE